MIDTLEIIENCRKALHHVRQMAMANIRPADNSAPRGGPFSAQLALLHADGTIELWEEAKGNAVMLSSMASNHAEHEVLSPRSYQALCEHLSKLDPVRVCMFSSAQSCTTCHTKQEIIARDLEQRNLIRRGDFLNIFGATYQNSLEIAGFNDIIYADAMLLADRCPQSSRQIIKRDFLSLAEVPPRVQELLSNATKPTSVLYRNGDVYAVGEDTRDAFDLFSTAEIMTLRAACLRNRQEGCDQPWSIDGTLYTTTLELGPLLFGELGWTNVSHVVHVKMPAVLASKQFESIETPKITNSAFFNLITRGYKAEDKAVTTYRDEYYNNEAQIEWAKLVKLGRAPLYNGAKETEESLKQRTETEKAFDAPLLSAYKSPLL